MVWTVPYCYINGLSIKIRSADIQDGLGSSRVGVLGNRRAVGHRQFLNRVLLSVRDER